MRQAEERHHYRQIQQPSAHHRRDQNRHRRNGSDFEAPQNIGFPLRHRAHAGAPQPIAQYPHGENSADEIGDAGAASGVEQLRKYKKENERKQVIEEEHSAVAKGQLQIALEQCDVCLHSRRLFPVSSMNASSSEGRSIRRSANSRPCASSHFTSSTTMRAGRRHVTVSFIRSEEHTPELQSHSFTSYAV